MKSTITLLIVLNILVLMGQVWPSAAPPFAKWVNIFFLVGTLGYFLNERKRKK